MITEELEELDVDLDKDVICETTRRECSNPAEWAVIPYPLYWRETRTKEARLCCNRCKILNYAEDYPNNPIYVKI